MVQRQARGQRMVKESSANSFRKRVDSDTFREIQKFEETFRVRKHEIFKGKYEKGTWTQSSY